MVAYNFQEDALSPPAVRDSQGSADGRVCMAVDVPWKDAPGC
jgi:hypothetical protein